MIERVNDDLKSQLPFDEQPQALPPRVSDVFHLSIAHGGRPSLDVDSIERSMDAAPTCRV
jgi:hypothetical protein